MPATRYPLLATLLRRYFYSGWAFLIPYLAAYLLYYITGWPVNPAETTAEGAAPLPLTPLTPYSSYRSPPSLLHLYWSLHAIHLVLAALALRSWWTGASAEEARSASDSQSTSYSSYRLHLLTRTAPWAILALIFYIPGVYLEWPSDPWEHLRRINEWRILDTVGAHSTWYKSSYFIPYSFLSWHTGLRQIFWLDFYYTGICMLLCWQYYRLSRACGLGERASMVFVIIQVLLFGNNIFSFYRYYGISSSIYAHLGAIALTRIVLDLAAHGTKRSSTLQVGKTTRKDPGAPVPHGSPTALHTPSLSPNNDSSYSLLNTHYSILRYLSRPPFWHLPPLLSLLVSGACLVLFIALNHAQGLGIACLSIFAVTVWRLIEWKRSVSLYLALAAILSSVATVVWFPRHAAIDGIFRTQGWLSPWYGFNIFSFGSPAFDRTAQILGAFGGLNIVLGLWLVVRRNSVAGWLTLMPVLALVLPCFALPFAHLVATNGPAEDILIFHRMLLAGPVGLALVALTMPSGTKERERLGHGLLAVDSARGGLRILFLFLILVLALPPGSNAYNRFWQSIQILPDDLQLSHLTKLWSDENRFRVNNIDTLTITSPLASEIKKSFRPDRYWNSSRLGDAAATTSELTQQLELLEAVSSKFDRPLPHLNTLGPDQLIFDRKSGRQKVVIVSNPTSTEAPWITLGGATPQQAFLAPQLLSLRNPPGRVSYPFSPELIPVSRYGRYHLSCRIRQSGASQAVNYLAIAWYDKNYNLLTSNQSLPQGAGSPAGWNNGTFSYFGLVGEPAATGWMSYSISFGVGETAAIPANASFLRIGALLNYNGVANADVELTEVRLMENDLQPKLLLSVPSFKHLSTPASPAAWLSRHWLPQYVPMSHAGTAELRARF